jgi:hypothetical protein
VGVTYEKRRNKWLARIQGSWLGYFGTKKEALAARKKAVENLPHIL